jgi:hypothetical protein
MPGCYGLRIDGRAFLTIPVAILAIKSNCEMSSKAIALVMSVLMVKGMAVSMTKMMLGGKFDEVLATVKGNYKHLPEIFD